MPARHDRELALQSVEPFIDAHSSPTNAPLVIATTRPQGWGEEFGGYLPLYLRELTLDESLAYSAQIIFARHPTQPRRRERIEERLRAAAKDDAVAQLLRTPLLAAIMVHLIADEGQAPRLRWEVFQRFYETIYNREVARGTTLSPVLAAMRPVVNELHRHAGLVLHALEERDNGSNAAVSRAWLRMAARRLMEVDDETSEDELRRVDELIEAVEQRLVLLVEREPGRFSYELRSLQEFMAAWALTTGIDAHVEARFKAIAGYSAWRNVLLLAMGRLFYERSPLRESLSLGLCEWLRDNASVRATSVSISSILALDIADDGLAEHAPRLLAKLDALIPAGVIEFAWNAGDSGLSSPDVWRSLGLPEPTPEEPTSAAFEALVAAANARALSLDIVALDEIHVANLRCLADVHVTDLDRPDDRGQWIVFLGENGAGKSTLLRAVALALTHRDNASAALKDARAFYVRHGATHGTCAVHLRGRRSLLTIRRDDDTESAEPNGYHGEFPWVVAYGCRRGNALGDRDSKRAQTPYANIATLFDDDRGLIDVETWITLQEAASKNDDGAQRAYEAVTRSLGQAIGHTFLPARKDGLWVRPASGPDVQFSSLSDGYLTMAGWIGDLLIRYVSRHHDLRELPDDFAKQMTGVVLIDEIDQNLHPRWQVRVIQEVRRLFERMTFVATTHNPLTLAGARKSEVFLLTKREGGDFTVEPAQFDPRLRTGTELYSKFFGIDDVFPNELGRSLHRYGTLSGNPYRTDEEEAELARIRELLAREGVTPDFEPVTRESDA
ncbi:MAG: AAA family ATPase [Polyangiales bacterium]